MLVSSLSAMTGARPGDLRATLIDVPSLSGVQIPEPGWLLCNGVLVSTTTYYQLFAECGFAFSPGPGNDPGGGNFYLPRLIDGCTPVAMGPTNFTVRGLRAGQSTVPLSEVHLPSHYHTYYDGLYPRRPAEGWLSAGPDFGTTDVVNDYAGNVTSFTGGGGAHENMSPYQVIEAWLVRYL